MKKFKYRGLIVILEHYTIVGTNTQCYRCLMYLNDLYIGFLIKKGSSLSLWRIQIDNHVEKIMSEGRKHD